MRRIFLVGCFLAALSLAQTKKFALTIDNIMRGPALYGYEPRAVRWSGSSDHIYFQWKQAGDSHRRDFDLYVVHRNGTGLRKLTEEESKLAPPAQADRTIDKHRAVYALDGDIFLYDYTTDMARRITRTIDPESNPRFLRDGKRISFTRSGNLYAMSLDSPAIVQLTDIRPATIPGAALLVAAPVVTGLGFGEGEGQGRNANSCPPEQERKGTESQEFVKKEERTLLELVRERQQKCEDDAARRRRENPRKPHILVPRQAVASLELSPDEKYVIATIVEPGEGTKNTIVPNFVSLSSYTEDIGSRSKVGDLQQRVRMAVISTETGELKWLDHGIKQQVQQAPTPSQDRPIILFGLQWSEDGTKAFLEGRSADNKDQWIFGLDAVGAKLRVIATMHDDAWIINARGRQTTGWMKEGKEIYFISELDGYAHLYAVPFEGGKVRQITGGKFEVLNAQLCRDKTRFFLTTNEGDPADRHFYEMSAGGGPRKRISSMAGHNTAVTSPDEKYVAVVYSHSGKPPELYVQENFQDAKAVRLTSSPAPEFWDYDWRDVPIVRIPARDGAMVPGHLYKPKNYARGGPAVIFVHGSGYVQNVHHGWSSYSHEYLFHHLLMENGYLVLDLDYRGSAGYGRDWRTGIYRHMGGKDLDDQVDAARWLVSQHGVDTRRIGIYGGSYGGFITLMAMFTQPDVFAAGAALRPVTDWAHYNNGYTANILNAPQNDSEAYRQSSPIYFAGGLKGALLICHGMVDTNVHFQDTVRLTQKLIELHKENWELAVYPAEDHAFQEPSSWADEYKRIFRLFEKSLKKH